MPSGADQQCTALMLAVGDLTLAAQRYRLRAARALFGVGPTEMIALSWMYLVGSCGPTDLTRWLSMTSASVSALLDRLEGAGHVVRRPHPSDRRRIVVCLTEPARCGITRAHRAGVDAVSEAVTHYGPEERRAIAQFLSAIPTVYDTMAFDDCGSPYFSAVAPSPESGRAWHAEH